VFILCFIKQNIGLIDKYGTLKTDVFVEN